MDSGVVAEHHLGGTATKVDDHERTLRRVELADGAGERQTASSSPVMTSASAPGITAPSTSRVMAKKSVAIRRVRVADVATIRPAVAPGFTR